MRTAEHGRRRKNDTVINRKAPQAAERRKETKNMIQHQVNACILDDAKIAIVRTSPRICEDGPLESVPDDRSMAMFDEIRGKLKESCITVTIPTAYLKAFVDNVTGDAVKITAATDYPAMVQSQIEDVDVSMLISPRIDMRDDE